MLSLVCFEKLRTQYFKRNIIVLSGGFLGGLIIPRDGGLAIALTEKLEDIVSIVFLPLVSFAV